MIVGRTRDELERMLGPEVLSKLETSYKVLNNLKDEGDCYLSHPENFKYSAREGFLAFTNGYLYRNLQSSMTKSDFVTRRTQIISKMLDNPDKHGIYPTTNCFVELDDIFDELTGNRYEPSTAQRLSRGAKDI